MTVRNLVIFFHFYDRKPSLVLKAMNWTLLIFFHSCIKNETQHHSWLALYFNFWSGLEREIMTDKISRTLLKMNQWFSSECESFSWANCRSKVFSNPGSFDEYFKIVIRSNLLRRVRIIKNDSCAVRVSDEYFLNIKEITRTKRCMSKIDTFLSTLPIYPHILHHEFTIVLPFGCLILIYFFRYYS